MPRFVVLLRGVNVGRGNRVPMAAFKSMLEGLGCTDVATLLNSGNAAFTSRIRSTAKLSSAIAGALHESLGLTVPTIVKSAAEVVAVVAANPLAVPETDHARFLVAFAPDAATLHALRPLQTLAQAPERFVVGDEAAYLHCATGILDSQVGAALLGRAGQAVTTRNWATVLKLSALAGPQPAS